MGKLCFWNSGSVYSSKYHPSRKLHQRHYLNFPGDVPWFTHMHYKGYTPFCCQIGWWLSILFLVKIPFWCVISYTNSYFMGLSSISTHQTTSLRDFYLGFNVLTKAEVITWHGDSLSLVCLQLYILVFLHIDVLRYM